MCHKLMTHFSTLVIFYTPKNLLILYSMKEITAYKGNILFCEASYVCAFNKTRKWKMKAGSFE